jgi:hypothetical protein
MKIRFRREWKLVPFKKPGSKLMLRNRDKPKRRKRRAFGQENVWELEFKKANP